MDFFSRIKLQVKRNNTTIETLMKKVLGKKFSREIYQGWRHRGSIPRADVCLQMADLLHVSVRYLITGEEDENDVLQSRFLKYENLLERLDTLSVSDVETVEVLVEGLQRKANLNK